MAGENDNNQGQQQQQEQTGQHADDAQQQPQNSQQQAGDQGQQQAGDQGQQRHPSGAVDETPAWARRRFDELTGRIHEGERAHQTTKEELARANAENERLKSQLGGGQHQQPQVGGQQQGQQQQQPVVTTGDPQRSQFKTQEEFDAAVEAAANEKAETASFNRNCNTVFDKGVSAFGEKEFGAATENLRMLGAMRRDVLDGILAVENPEKVLFELGRDPNKAADILSKPPAARIAEFVKISSSQVQVSKAPAPLTPLGGNNPGPDGGLSDDLDDATWMQRRNEQDRRRATGGR